MDNPVTALSIIETIKETNVTATLSKIAEFQKMIQTQLQQNKDYGIIPGTQKPTLLKPGAEKICMLLGVRTEFELMDSTRDFKAGFFQYMVKCIFFKDNTIITEGMGSANTMEKKYLKTDAYTADNTVLKMAKKRALIDGTLLIGSLSEVFSQDMIDEDLDGNIGASHYAQQISADDGAVITSGQAKRLYAISKGNAELCKTVLKKHGYDHSADIKKVDYEKIAEEIEAEASK